MGFYGSSGGLSQAHRDSMREKREAAERAAASTPAAIAQRQKDDSERVQREDDARAEFWRKHHEKKAAVAAAGPVTPPAVASPVNLQALTTSEKILKGLGESKPVGSVVSHGDDTAVDQARKAREARFAVTEPGLDRASNNLRIGLSQSVPARGPRNPAA